MSFTTVLEVNAHSHVPTRRSTNRSSHLFWPRSRLNRFCNLCSFPVHQISEAEIAERGKVAAELAATRDDQMRLCAAEVEARIERDKKNGLLETIVGSAHMADGRRLHRICPARPHIA